MADTVRIRNVLVEKNDHTFFMVYSRYHTAWRVAFSYDAGHWPTTPRYEQKRSAGLPCGTWLQHIRARCQIIAAYAQHSRRNFYIFIAGFSSGTERMVCSSFLSRDKDGDPFFLGSGSNSAAQLSAFPEAVTRPVRSKEEAFELDSRRNSLAATDAMRLFSKTLLFL